MQALASAPMLTYLILTITLRNVVLVVIAIPIIQKRKLNLRKVK